MPTFLYNLLVTMAIETQKGRENFPSHHYLIKFLVEKSLQEVSGMS